ncbi:IS6 family transposase [Vibrio sp. 10N.222.47.A9]|uniref:IS6 family transposase n=1 Tax=Vibrio sp. 10N.222.47.A9 TaxID=1903178 RepID=UPI0009784A28|nr:IS6 family transposase [Vibrio sp. 10N.222.47.A9]OMO26534.1 IS6 family transposase [Vibrio sp. 10N.222.47.A9]
MFKGCHFPSEVILETVRYYLAYKLSYREIEEIQLERGVVVDHTTINRWVIKFTPVLEHRARRRKKPVSDSWRMDETYIKVKGKWVYYYRAVDKFGNVIDYYISPNRDEAAAKAFLNEAISQNGLPSKVVIDGSKSNYAAIDSMNVQLWLTGYFMLSLVEILDIKYLNNIVEQSHRWVKQKTRQALGWKSTEGALASLHGREVWTMLKQDQIDVEGHTAFELFHALAA